MGHVLRVKSEWIFDLNTTNMKGLFQTIVAPFYPFGIYNNIKHQSEIGSRYLLAFCFVILVGTFFFHSLSQFEYYASNIKIVSSLGFLIGLALRITLIAYTISISVTQFTKKKFSFAMSFALVTLASTTLLYPFFIYWLNPKFYPIADIFSQFWFAIIIAIGISETSQIKFLASLLLAIIAVVMYWLITVTFLPYGITI